MRTVLVMVAKILRQQTLEMQELAKFLAKNGQALLPMVELIEQSKLALDELIDVLGRSQIRRCYGCPRKGSPLARRQDGAALGRCGIAHDRTELSKDYGSPRSVDAEGSLRWKSNFVEEAGGVK
jgi:hypothetical protein